MARIEFSRQASIDEMAREIDRRGAVIEKLEAELAKLQDPVAVRISLIRGTIAMPEGLVWKNDRLGCSGIE